MDTYVSTLSRFLWVLAPLLSHHVMASTHVGAHIGLTTEFVRDGISQTPGTGALQIGLEAENSIGFYGGVWGSSVDTENDIDFEVDSYIGIYSSLNDRWAIDTSITYFDFYGDDGADGLAYSEPAVRLLYKDAWTFGYRQSLEYFGTETDQSIIELAYTFQKESFAIELFAGYHLLDEPSSDINFGSDQGDNDYLHVRLGVTRSYGKWDYRFLVDRTTLGSEFDGGTSIQFGVYRYFDFF